MGSRVLWAMNVEVSLAAASLAAPTSDVLVAVT